MSAKATHTGGFGCFCMVRMFKDIDPFLTLSKRKWHDT